ncbi:glycosyltransferase [Providencia rettgeri]|uniref:glycosyltransferase n=1 Tax=Providencia rettgeri TaxID=587 RepID=UPI00165812FC|nr:glycosyltransferase [Providencia rettgeri]QNP21733.1 glycosyltransferase [Providencia rettgeri]
MQAISKLICPSSEEGITAHWKYTDKIYISCVCIVFNHELYIEDTIDSILAQKSEHKFEVIIHDDCSTDSTKSILLEYKNRFPNIIKLILQEENQHSKGYQIMPFISPFVEGEFVAVCEGDDYWIRDDKIKKQFDLLNNNKVNICFSSCKSISPDNFEKIISYHGDNELLFSTEQVVEGGGAFMPTASLMLRSDIIKKLPEWFYHVPVGDYFIQIIASIPNGALYLPEVTCVYRTNAVGSWSSYRKNLTSDEINTEAILYESSLSRLKEYGISKEVINNVIAKQYLTLTKLAIKNGFFVDSKSLIIKSWFFSKYMNKNQFFLYYTREIHPLIKLMYLIKIKIF